ncbi:MAG: glycoside hydrolase family 2 TIM barrel-domain containing protein [Kiritimatiellia bacterium]
MIALLLAFLGWTEPQPARNWQESSITGNGTIGAMVRGNLNEETITISHAALYLPEPGTKMPRLQNRAEPSPDDYVERDGFMAACDLRIGMDVRRPTDYVRGTDFETGECFVRAKDGRGCAVERRVVALTEENVIAVRVADEGKRSIAFALTGVPLASRADMQAYVKGIREIVSTPQYYRCDYRHSNPWNPSAGYEVVLVEGRIDQTKGVREAYVAVAPFTATEKTKRSALEAQAMAAAKQGYDALVARQAERMRELMGRVSFELEGPKNAAEIVSKFNAARYNIISSTGGRHVPNLQGIWAGTWSAPWKASFTVNGNMPCAISFFNRGATPELNEVLLGWIEDRLPAMREGARLHYHARGFRAAAQTTMAGVETDFNPNYPHLYWHGGAAWLLSRLYDGFQHTQDLAYLKRIYPLMKEQAGYYEDVLVEMADGTLGFLPSYSPENQPKGKRPTSVNATMDNAIAKQFLDEVVAAGSILGESPETLASWTAMRARLTPYAVSEEGCFAEWLAPDQADNNEHRHASHLYPLYDQAPAEIVTNAALVAAVKQTIDARMDFNENRSKTMAFGYVQNGLAAAHLGDAERAERCLKLLTAKSWLRGGGSCHDWNNCFNTDISGGYPYLISAMLVQSAVDGTIRFLPARPKSWKKGALRGLLLRGNIRLKELVWEGDIYTATLAYPDGRLETRTNRPPAWENPRVNAINKLPPRDELIPCATEAEARALANLELERTASRWVMDLNGTWAFDWRKRPDVDWEVVGETIAVPGCWQLARRKDGGRYDPPIYTNYNYPHVNNPPHIMEDPPTNFTQFVYRNPVGRYTRTFTIPSAWQDRRIILHFNGVASAMEVRVNGSFVGYSEDSRLPAEFDITTFLNHQPSTSNLLSVEVYRWCDGSYLEDQDFWRLSGIYRDVWLQAEGQDSPHDPTTLVSGDLRPGEKTWTPEEPNLYVRTYQAPNGDWYAWNVGHRTIAISNAVVYVNGERLVVKGVNRHEMSPTAGYTLTHAEMEADVKLLKSFGFNAVRTCHYPNDTYWYRLCDKYGLLLVSEANVECHGSGQGNRFRSCARRPEWRDAFIERGTNMVVTFRTHPSIYFWSLGNECWDGANLQAEYDAMKAIDVTRPIQYSTGKPEPYSDILAPMYHKVAWCGNYATNNPSKPLILCEYSHAMGNSCGGLFAYADLAKREPSFQGGFIWDFADQALLVDGVLNYGGDFGDVPNNSNSNCNGIFDPFRKPHPSAYEAAVLNGVAPHRGAAALGVAPRTETPPHLPTVLASLRRNFARAETDNDRGAKLSRQSRVWFEATKTQLLPKGVTEELSVAPQTDGSTRVAWTLHVPEGLPPIPRVGLSFRVPGRPDDVVRWTGCGPYENYDDRKTGLVAAPWAMTVTELNDSGYVRPQECGYRTGTTKLEVAGLAFEAGAGTSFGFNVWPWTQEALAKAAHVEALPAPDGTLTVNIDAVQMGVGGDDSWGAMPLPPFIPGTGTYSLSFVLSHSK